MAAGLNSERCRKVCEVHMGCMWGFSKSGTNETWLQLVRSCAIQFDWVFLISKVWTECMGCGRVTVVEGAQ